MILDPTWRIGNLDLTASPFLVAFGADHGAPENVADVLRSLLGSGDIEVSSHTGNRTVTIPVLIEAANLDVLAEAEALLIAECDKDNELYCDPGDGVAAPMVFEVFRGQVTFNRDDDYEQAGYRSYTLTFRALPYVLSSAVTITAALAASGSTTTLVDAMSATTNWTGAVNGGAVTPVTAGGALSVTSTALDGVVTITMTRTASITTSSTKYLVLDWKIGAGSKYADVPASFSAVADGVTLLKLSSVPSPTAGYTRTTFYVAAASVAVLTITSITDSPHPGKHPYIARSLTLDNLDRSDIRPLLGSVKQQVRILDIGGSVPTTGSLSVQHATSALGDVVVYTYPDDGGQYAPPCRNYRVSGPTANADANAISGFRDIIDTATTFDVPVAATPEGEYLVVARIGRNNGTAGTHTVTWTAEARVNSVYIGGQATYSTTFTTTTAPFDFIRLGMVHLPLVDAAPHGTAVTRFTIVSANPGVDDLHLDDLLLFNMTTGRLSQFACGTAAPGAGGTSNRLWIESPSIANDGLGRYLRGFASDQSDAYSAYLSAATPGVHEFTPPRVKVYTAATNPTTSVDVAFAHRSAWHSNAAS